MAYNLVVIYQLSGPATHYRDVENAVKGLGEWAHFESSTWYVKSNFSPVQARDHIRSKMRAGDTLFVAAMESAAWQGVSKECGDFIRERWTK